MREIHNGILLKSIPFDVRKSTIALFMAEVLYRLIGESEENRELFEFIWGSVEALDALEEGVANFHLWFLANISHFLGFSPGNEYHEGDWFDMREGLYTDIMPLHDEACKPEPARLLARLLACRVDELGAIALSRSQRVEMLTLLVNYYSIHLDSIRRVESIRILQEVF